MVPIPKEELIRKAAKNSLPMLLALIVSSSVVIGSSNAAFSGLASNNGSEWRAGTISIGNSAQDSIRGQELFNDSKIVPGYISSRCVTVNSRSDIDTRAKMYGVNVSDSPLSEAMRVRIDKGQANSADANGTSCDSFRDSETLYEGALAAFGRDVKDYSQGLSSSSHGDHLSPGGRAVYRITIILPEDADNSISASEAEATFKWEAQG